MAKFLFLFRGGECATEKSPEEMQRIMEEWRRWIEAGRDAGWLLDAGDGLKPEGRVVSAGTVSDGPFAESKELVGGYCMAQADDLEGATKLALSMPATGGAIEVRELAGQAM